jgi:hypothetical protein
MDKGKQGCCDDEKGQCCEVKGGACCSDDGDVAALSKDELLSAKTSLEQRLKDIDDAIAKMK